MSFEEADRFTFEVLDFLKGCGEPYSSYNWEVHEFVLMAVSTNQFLYEKNKFFICWWRINKEDIEKVKKRKMPKNIFSGQILYMVECGCRDKKIMVEMLKKLRRVQSFKGLCWNSHKRKQFRMFKNQKGGDSNGYF